MAKKKKKDNIEFEVGLDGSITKYNENKNRNSNNDIEFEVGLDGTIKKNTLMPTASKNKYQAKSKAEKDKSLLEKVGDFGLGTLKTVGNIATSMGEGALRTGEGILDFSNSVVDRATNALTEKAEVLTGVSTNEEAKKHRKENDERSRNFIKRDLTNEFQEKVGFNDIQKDWEKGSLVKENNLGGQIAQGIGGMVPSLLVGQYTGLGEVANTSTKGMKLGEKILTTAKNTGKQAISNLGGTSALGAGTYGQSLQEAYQNGATDEEASKYAIGSTAKEIATEWITGGIPGLNGTGGLDKPVEKLIDKTTGKLKNEYGKAIAKTLANYGYKFIGEGLEEGISEVIDPYLKNATYSKNEKVNWEDVLNSFIVGGITGGILEAPNTITEYNNNLTEARNDTQKNKIENIMPSINTPINNQNNIQENPLLQENTPINMPSAIPNNNINNSQINENVQNNPSLVENNNEINPTITSSIEEQFNNINPNQTAYQYESSNNSKIDSLRKSASQYLNNSNESKSFIQVAEKVINDKNYNIIFDDNLETSNGNKVNAQIKTLENGEIEIRINPNSERAGEFLLTHEITHSIETQEMINLVMDYASKNKDFKNALESLKETYNTNDVSSEVLADISGQLFGNQEFINNLSTNKPNIFKRIYDSIISLANKITGNSKESLFIKDLKNKWEKAYRESSNEAIRKNLNESPKYMITGKKGAKELAKLTKDNIFISNYKEAQQMYKENKTAKEIRKKTGWYKDVNKDWKFEISDQSAEINSNLKINSNYTLEEVLSHEYLYKMYPKAKKIKIKFKDMNQNNYGTYNKITGNIEINNNIIKNAKKLEETLLHEVQHYIQKKEAFQNGTYIGDNFNKYKNNFGETEAREVYKRKNMSFDERINIPSETQLYNKNSKNKLYTKDDVKDYNIFKGDSYAQEAPKNNKEDILQNRLGGQGNLTEDKLSDDYSTQEDQDKISRKELIESSFSFDENAKQYTLLKDTKKIEFYTKDNGNIKITLLDNNSEAINDFTCISEKHLKQQLGNEIGEYINSKSTSNVSSIDLENNKSNISDDLDYKMNHRPSEDYGNASNFESNMADIFEHPEWYLDMSASYNKESLNALRKVRNNPEGNLKIYRATPGDKINPGDWVTPSKKYAQEHLERSLNGDGKIIEMTVKAKDVLFAGDDINEFGYFPENMKYSKKDGTWQEFVESNFKSRGSKTLLNDIKINTDSTEQRLINKETNRITKKYDSEKNRKTKIITKDASKILEFSDYQQKRKFGELVSEYYDNPDLNKIKQDIKDNFSEKRIEYVNEYVKDIKNQIRGTELQINDYVRRNLTDFNNFRRENFNKLKLKSDGQSIDSFYNELADSYPSIFSKDITNEVDQLERMSEFMNEDDKFYEKYNLDDDVINEAARYVYDSIKNKDNVDDLINSISISPKQIRKEKTTEYREFASDFLENSSDWKDKKSGLAYKVNTMKRNFYDIMGRKDADRLYKNFIEPIFNHNSQMQNDISKYNDKINKLKLNDNESIAVQMFGELKYNPETLVTQMQVDEFIEKNKLDYDKISKSVEVFRNIYDELLERRNATLKAMGYKEIDYRKGYFPHFVENKPTSIFGKALEKIGWKFNDDSIPTSIAGITEQFKPGKIWTSSSQQRKGKFTDYNALKGFDNYIRGAMNEIYFTEDIQKLRALENEIRYQHSDKGIQNKIDEIQSDSTLTFDEKQDKIDKVYANYITPLNNFVTELRDYTNGLANKKSGLDRTMESLSNRKFYNVMNNISSRLSANMVGLNLGSAITNFIPITQATSQVKSKYLLKGLKEAIKSQYSSDGFESKSVFLTTRLNEAERLYKTRLEKISEKANFIFDGIDSITANTIVRGKYYENISKGMTEFNAMRNADEFARDLMAGRGKGEMPTAFNSKNPLVKAFTAFQLETANQFGYMLKDLPRDIGDEAKNKLVSAFIKMFFGAWIYNQFTEKLVGRKAAFSPADTIKEIYDTSKDENLKITEKSSKILENLTSDIPFVGGLVGGGRLPISTVANPIKVIKGESTLKDETKKALYYTVMPFGGGQLKKTIEGASMYINNKDIKGSYNKKGELKFEAKKDPLSITQNILFGQYSSKNARDYFNNNYMPVSKETMERLKKNNISISQYRNYEDKYNSIKNSKGKKLKDIKSDKDSTGKIIAGSSSAKKAYLIMKSNFSTKEKNYMLSKLSNFKNDKIDVKTLNKLDNDKKAYNLYYSLSNENKNKFISELDNYSISASQLTEFYNMRKETKKEYTSAKSKEIVMDYLSKSNLDENTKWYFYSKYYGSDKLNQQIKEFNIKSDDYFKVIKYKNSINNRYPGEKNSKRRKNEIFKYIDSLKLNKNQKIILFKHAGYSNTIGKKVIYNYVNSKDLSKQEKRILYEDLY